MPFSLWRRDLERINGLTSHCPPGTYRALIDAIERHSKFRQGVLDLGARHGTLLSMLRQAGYSDLNAVDLDVADFKLSDVPIRRLDLNQDFAHCYQRKFNLVISTEVIEHLESPRHFLAETRKLLSDDGLLCITTPNIAYWVGRVKFALRGEHWGFGERAYRDQRHISPITFGAMRLTMAEIGLRLVHFTTGGSFSAPLRKILTAPFAGLFRAVGGKSAFGESAIYLAAKCAPEEALSHPAHYYGWDNQTAPLENQRNANSL